MQNKTLMYKIISFKNRLYSNFTDLKLHFRAKRVNAFQYESELIGNPLKRLVFLCFTCHQQSRLFGDGATALSLIQKNW